MVPKSTDEGHCPITPVHWELGGREKQPGVDIGEMEPAQLAKRCTLAQWRVYSSGKKYILVNGVRSNWVGFPQASTLCCGKLFKQAIRESPPECTHTGELTSREGVGGRGGKFNISDQPYRLTVWIAWGWVHHSIWAVSLPWLPVLLPPPPHLSPGTPCCRLWRAMLGTVIFSFEELSAAYKVWLSLFFFTILCSGVYVPYWKWKGHRSNKDRGP